MPKILFKCLVLSFCISLYFGLIHELTFVVERTLQIVDGVLSDAVTINGSIIGPALAATVGDTFLIKVQNDMLVSEGISMHWHGISQKNTPWADGPAFVTNCPIAFGASFTYNFTVDEPGTYWYHAHIGNTMVEGVAGFLVVYDDDNAVFPAQTRTQFGSLVYDDEIHILLTDWYHPSVYTLSSTISQNPFQWVGEGDSILVNGLGETATCPFAHPAVTTQSTDYGDGSSITSSKTCQGKRASFSLDSTRKYLVRIASASNQVFLNLAIGGHTFTLLGLDGGGSFLQPIEVNSIDINSGQRIVAALNFKPDASIPRPAYPSPPPAPAPSPAAQPPQNSPITPPQGPPSSTLNGGGGNAPVPNNHPPTPGPSVQPTVDILPPSVITAGGNVGGNSVAHGNRRSDSEEEGREGGGEDNKEPHNEGRSHYKDANSTEHVELTIPTFAPSKAPKANPTVGPSAVPTVKLTHAPSFAHTESPSAEPTLAPTVAPSVDWVPLVPISDEPSLKPTHAPSAVPTEAHSPTDVIVAVSVTQTLRSVSPNEYFAAQSAYNRTIQQTVAATIGGALEQITNIVTLPAGRRQLSSIADLTVTYTVLALDSETTPSAIESAITKDSASGRMAKRLQQYGIANDLPSLANVVFTVPEYETITSLEISKSASPTVSATVSPSPNSSHAPTVVPSTSPSFTPSEAPTAIRSEYPTVIPSEIPSAAPSAILSETPSVKPGYPSALPTVMPTEFPQADPTVAPTAFPSVIPSAMSSTLPSVLPSRRPSSLLFPKPTTKPSVTRSANPTAARSVDPDREESHSESDSSEGFFRQKNSQEDEGAAAMSDDHDGHFSVRPTFKPTTKAPTLSRIPSQMPVSRWPTVQRSRRPSVDPTNTRPSAEPTSKAPVPLPSRRPTAAPSSSEPSELPSVRPRFNNQYLSSVPFKVPYARPTRRPSARPSALSTTGTSGHAPTNDTLPPLEVNSNTLQHDSHRMLSQSAPPQTNFSTFTMRVWKDWTGRISDPYSTYALATVEYTDLVARERGRQPALSPEQPPNESRDWFEWYNLLRPLHVPPTAANDGIEQGERDQRTTVLSNTNSTAATQSASQRARDVRNGCPSDAQVTKQFKLLTVQQYVDMSTGRGFTPPTKEPGIPNTQLGWTVYNNSRLMMPTTPYLLNSYLRHRSNVSDRFDYSDGKKEGALAPLRIELGDVVDVTVQITASKGGSCDVHPWHLHGHSFWLVGRGQGLHGSQSDSEVDATRVNSTLSPLLMDTVSGYPSNFSNRREDDQYWAGSWQQPCGWFTIRFVADNPGMWLFHCHQGWHMEMGMAVVFDESSELVAARGLHPPADYPLCGAPGQYGNSFFAKSTPSAAAVPQPVPSVAPSPDPPTPPNEGPSKTNGDGDSATGVDSNAVHARTVGILLTLTIVFALTTFLQCGVWFVYYRKKGSTVWIGSMSSHQPVRGSDGDSLHSGSAHCMESASSSGSAGDDPERALTSGFQPSSRHSPQGQPVTQQMDINALNRVGAAMSGGAGASQHYMAVRPNTPSAYLRMSSVDHLLVDEVEHNNNTTNNTATGVPLDTSPMGTLKLKKENNKLSFNINQNKPKSEPISRPESAQKVIPAVSDPFTNDSFFDDFLSSSEQPPAPLALRENSFPTRSPMTFPCSASSTTQPSLAASAAVPSHLLLHDNEESFVDQCSGLPSPPLHDNYTANPIYLAPQQIPHTNKPRTGAGATAPKRLKVSDEDVAAFLRNDQEDGDPL